MTNVNHARLPRKTLSSQIDRLDSILDGLAEALNGTVADAVSEAVGRAVREAIESTLREVLANPTLLRAALAAHEPQEAAPEAPAPQRTLKEALLVCLKHLVGGAGERTSRAGEALRSVWSMCLAKFKSACAQAQARFCHVAVGAAGALTMICRAAYLLWEFRRGCLLALGAGLAAGAAAYHAGPFLAGVLSGLSGAALSVAGMIRWPLRRLTRGGETTRTCA